MTVSTLQIVCMALSALVITGVFAALFFVFKCRFKQPWQAFLFGCLTFLVSALVLEQILHSIVLSSPLGVTLTGNIWLYGLYGALAAALFEETGRFLTMKFLLKKHHGNDNAGIMYGAGHGGFEAFVILGLTMFSNIMVALQINSGALQAQTASLDAASLAAVQAQVMALCSTPAWMYPLGLLERLFAITAQIAMSVVMWRGVTKKNGGYIALAFALHFVLDFVSVVAASFAGTIGTEIIIGLLSVGMALLARKLCRK